ncbi:nitric oxide reductase activation protein NorD [Aquabacterium sp. OR-4]|uniref:nitric oxide reductase activation protein NorD n=1 Tax=Aquabacterium sp. OR-4 TaxID=2978127 RepID=UPI0028C5A1CE|nr:VWA domain-containing protein [Aquabacterium sp. OR-4]MDT7838695.1 VWA domain-containing protein [Aquabacterium sp. OR-4]
MEEWIGALWHRAITRAAEPRHAAAVVTLAEMRPLLGLLLRAGGGAAAARLVPAGNTAVAGAAGARHWLQRLAHAGTRAPLPQWSAEVLALPPELAVFDSRALNRDLYVWLAAVAAVYQPGAAGSWIGDNQLATQRALQVFPGLAGRHGRLVAAQLAQRPDARGAPAEARVQAALRAQALAAPVDLTDLTHLADPAVADVLPAQVAPVWLWWHASGTPEAGAAAAPPGEPSAATPAPTPAQHDATRRRARRVDDERRRAALILPFRAEALLSWSELVRVDRATDDDENPDALAAAADLDHLSLARDGRSSASRVKFDLDLPSAAADDLPLGDGLALPEWDFRRRVLRAGHCRAQWFTVGADAAPGPAPGPALQLAATRARRQLEALRAAPAWQRAQRDGDELDLDAWVRHAAGAAPRAAAGGPADAAPPVHAQRRRQARSLATLLLADLSLSTDAYVPGVDEQGRAQRVIDVVRDALQVFGEALSATGDAFEMFGFSSVRRQQVRLQHLKHFDERWDSAARQRVAAIRPGYYTRMGAAIRVATQRLARRPERQRLLLLLTDGKPNDLDLYEGRYGLEDTRHAVQAARAAGLLPFAVTIDDRAHDYLPYLFGRQGWLLVRRPAELVRRLPMLQAQLMR